MEVGARPHLLPSDLGAKERDLVMDLSCPSPRNLRPSTGQRHVRQRQHLLLPPLSKQLEPLKPWQRRLIQVQPHCLQQQQFLSRHPRADRHIRLIVCSVDPRMLPLLVKVGALPERIDLQVSSSSRPTFPGYQYLEVSFSCAYECVCTCTQHMFFLCMQHSG